MAQKTFIFSLLHFVCQQKFHLDVTYIILIFLYFRKLIIFIAVFCHGTSLKKNLTGHVVSGTRVAGVSQQTCYPLDHHTSPN